MKNDYKNLFGKLGGQEVPLSLYSDIIFKLEKAKFEKARNGLMIEGTFVVTSFIAIFPIFMNVIKGFSSSGFWQYFSLLFTDSGVVLSNWKVFATSLLESAPFYEMTILLVVVFVLLESTKFAFKNLEQVLLPTN
ncbi:MAG: hypothetical protein WCC74_00315 [Minisyncoccia bacterium]